MRRISGLGRHNIMLALAQAMVENYGDGAEAEAERRSRRCFEEGDRPGSDSWDTIRDAIREARNLTPSRKMH